MKGWCLRLPISAYPCLSSPIAGLLNSSNDRSQTCVYIYIYICIQTYLSLSIYIYIYTCICIYTYIYIYIYTEREREREAEREIQHLCIYMYIYICICVCVYVYIYRERERGRVLWHPGPRERRCLSGRWRWRRWARGVLDVQPLLRGDREPGKWCGGAGVGQSASTQASGGVWLSSIPVRVHAGERRASDLSMSAGSGVSLSITLRSSGPNPSSVWLISRCYIISRIRELGAVCRSQVTHERCNNGCGGAARAGWPANNNNNNNNNDNHNNNVNNDHDDDDNNIDIITCNSNSNNNNRYMSSYMIILMIIILLLLIIIIITTTLIYVYIYIYVYIHT